MYTLYEFVLYNLYMYEFVLYNLYKKRTNYMNPYLWICTKISGKKKETRLGFQLGTMACNRRSGTLSTTPPPPLVPILCIYRKIRTPSEKWDCTNSFVQLIVNPFTGLFSDRTLTDRTLFWMASVRCDFQHQSVWSVFACGRKKKCVRSEKTTLTERKKLFFSFGRCWYILLFLGGNTCCAFDCTPNVWYSNRRDKRIGKKLRYRLHV